MSMYGVKQPPMEGSRRGYHHPLAHAKKFSLPFANTHEIRIPIK